MPSLAIIGAGSSGLITLKHALDLLPDWEISCYEKTGSLRGCWGTTYPGFLSTSTKYTTQFACYAPFQPTPPKSPQNPSQDFFQGNAYGDYLEEFAHHFQLPKHIQLHTQLSHAKRQENHWQLHFTHSQTQQTSQLRADYLILCTGLAEKPKADLAPQLQSLQAAPDTDWESLRNERIIILGGGESAVDLASRLTRPAQNNQVSLSLRHGIRVSPRYHPIRGVPSDYLRNRLLLSIRKSWRNRIGEQFVRARIAHQQGFERLFPSSQKKNNTPNQRRKYWDRQLTLRAKDQLFNTFHTKSDAFLEAIGQERLQIIGPPQLDSPPSNPAQQNSPQNQPEASIPFWDFLQQKTLQLKPSLIIPQLGYQSSLSQLFEQPTSAADFYHGCLHHQDERLFLIGFARPIIGNIPTIAEQQALYILSHLQGRLQRPKNLTQLHAQERQVLEAEYPRLNTQALFPVEMASYCDQLAQEMGSYPSRPQLGSFKAWAKIQLQPWSTLHYLPLIQANQPNPQTQADQQEQQQSTTQSPKPPQSPRYTPAILCLLLGLIRLADRLTPKKKNHREIGHGAPKKRAS